MRSVVYRNLDQPFRVLGLNVGELAAICFIFVLGGELSEWFGFHRSWCFIFAIGFGVLCFGVRRSLGDLFVFRLIRFLLLPSQLRTKLFYW